MPVYPRPLARLIEELEKLPGIGPKSAQRLALHLLETSQEEATTLAEAIAQVKERIRTCGICFNLTDGEECAICSDPQRDKSVLCVVAEARDLLALERAGDHRGGYHVLQGLISPMDGVGVFLEAFETVGLTAGARSAHLVNGGLALLAVGNLQLDLSAGFGRGADAEDWFLGTGLSVRIPR